MGKVAFVFPGQGSQYVGMGKDLWEIENIKSIYESADKIVGYPISDLCFNGPEEKLKLTYNTQPAILLTSFVLFHLLSDRVSAPDFVAGHSLGEYSALVSSGALSLEEAIYAVHKRGLFMDEAVPVGVGAMAACLGGERGLIKTVCENVSDENGVVQVANYNCPGQIVISGQENKVKEASETLKQNGIKRIIPLEVSGPFHSSLMEPAANKFKSEVLDKLHITDAKIQVVSNVDAKPVSEANQIKENLFKQIHSSVLWEDSVSFMTEQGVDTFIEIGPGKVLTGLVKKINKNVKVYSINDVKTLNDVVEQISMECV